MRRKLIITLTSVHGTRQISLSQLGRYMVLGLLLLAGVGFALSNYLLVSVYDDLELLESEHMVLSSEYEQLNSTLEKVTAQRNDLETRYQEALGSQRIYLTELDQLSDQLVNLARERTSLSAKIRRVASERTRLEDQMGQLTEERERLLERNERMNQQLQALDRLAEERSALEARNQELVSRLGDLGASLGLGEAMSGLDIEARAQLLEQTARTRILLLHLVPNGLPAEFKRVTDDFGPRTHPVTKRKSLHRGVDLSMDVGTPVFATADGIVESAGTDTKGGFGKVIRLQHSYGFRTYYAHLDKLLVNSGEYVVKGQQIALSGNTGRSTGPHLHYEVRRLWTALDPEPFMSWSLENYAQLFEQVGDIDWDSLAKQYPLRMATTQSP